MNIHKIIFSPTGGTAKVGDIIGSNVGAADSTIDLLSNTTDFSSIAFGSDDLCIIAMPVFAGRVPAIAVERLKSMKSNGCRAIIVAVYGNRDIDDALVELLDESQAAGFCVIAAVKAVAEHSIMRQYGAGRPDADDIKDLVQIAQTIKEKLDSGNLSTPVVPGNRPYKIPGRLPLKPQRSKKCNGCGLCERQCPVGAIDLSRKDVVDKDRCITCIHCVSVCPQKAISLNPIILKLAAFKMRKAFAERKKNEVYI